METIEVSEYVSTDALEQIIIMEAQKLEAKGKARDKMEEPSATLSEDPFERRLRSQPTLSYGIAPTYPTRLRTQEDMERIRNARRQLF